MHKQKQSKRKREVQSEEPSKSKTKTRPKTEQRGEELRGKSLTLFFVIVALSSEFLISS
jgi:hypothetical protein